MMNSSFWSPILLSLQTAAVALLIVVVIGILIANWMSRKKFKGKVILETILLLPLVLPPTVVGFLLIVLLGRNSLIGSVIETLSGQPIMFAWPAAVIAAAVVAFPMMYQSAKTGFLSVDRRSEEAARVDGASEWKVFLYITLPLSVKALVAGVILSFARALGEFGATLMFAGNLPGKTQTMPTAIYVAFESGNMAAAWLWVSVIMVISFIMLLTTRLLN
jgi:molybdate transport system permease protein